MRLRKWLLFFVLAFGSTHAWAITFQTNGDLRFLGEFFGNRTLTTTATNLNSAHMIFRALLRPKLFITDNFVFVTEWDLLEPMLNEFPLTGGLGFPNIMLSTIPIKGYPLGLMQSISGSPISIAPITVTEFFFRWDADVVLIQVGRQSRHWGLGMIYDDGFSDPFANFKSVIDAVVGILPFGELDLQAGVFKGVDAFFNTEGEDFTHVYAQARHKQEVSKLETGVFFEYVFMGEKSNQAICGAPAPAGRAKGAAYFIVDAYGIVHPFNNVKLSAEVAYADGNNPLTPCAKTTWDTLSTFAAFADIEFIFPSLRVGLKTGFFQGDSNGAADSKNQAFFFIHPNMFTGLMFQRASFGLNTLGTPSVLFPYDAKPGFHTAGTGLFFLIPHGYLTFAENWYITLQIPVLFALTLGPVFAARNGTFMGAEADLTITHIWNNLLETTVYLAALLPGDFFDTAATSAKIGYAFGVLGSLQF